MVLRGTTIEEMAAAMLRSEQSPPTSPLVVVQRGAGLRPFVFLHGEFNGGGFYCRRLAARLGSDRPVAIIPPHGHDGCVIPATIEAMAADRLRALLDYQPHGPYLLGGYCNGGLVAFDMARQLRQCGELVDLLVLVDVRGMNSRFAWLKRLVTAVGRVLGLDDESCARAFATVRSLAIEIRNRPHTFGQALFHHAARGRRRRAVPPGQPIGAAAVRAHDERPVGAIYDEAYRLYGEIMDRYVPTRYDGRVVLFHSRAMARRSPGDATAGWRRVLAHPELRSIAGEHQTCLTDHLDDLATQLSDVLARVDAPRAALMET
jgi:thioesterase domain-containing protein